MSLDVIVKTPKMSAFALTTVTPIWRVASRSCELRELHRVLDVHRREVLAARDVECDLQRHRPVARVGRREVQHALEAGELLLDRRGDRLGDVLRGGAGIHGRNGDARRGDLRIARDRQQPNREHAEQREADRQHGGKDGRRIRSILLLDHRSRSPLCGG